MSLDFQWLITNRLVIDFAIFDTITTGSHFNPFTVFLSKNDSKKSRNVRIVIAIVMTIIMYTKLVYIKNNVLTLICLLFYTNYTHKITLTNFTLSFCLLFYINKILCWSLWVLCFMSPWCTGMLGENDRE